MSERGIAQQIIDPELGSANSRTTQELSSSVTQDRSSVRETPAELLKTIARLEEELRGRTVILAAAAHELKTPLSIVAGYIEVLLGGKPGPLNERQKQILAESQANCGRLQRFIQNFLTLAALETGKLTLKFETADLIACVHELFDVWLTRYQSKGVALYFPQSQIVEPFSFDYAKIQHVISNLLENALKFTPPGGTVWLLVEPQMWERRISQSSRISQERRRVSGKGQCGASDRGRHRNRHFARIPRRSVCGFLSGAGGGKRKHEHGPRTGDRPSAGAGARWKDLGGKRSGIRQ